MLSLDGRWTRKEKSSVTEKPSGGAEEALRRNKEFEEETGRLSRRQTQGRGEMECKDKDVWIVCFQQWDVTEGIC